MKLLLILNFQSERSFFRIYVMTGSKNN